jgi:hypothetical protein
LPHSVGAMPVFYGYLTSGESVGEYRVEYLSGL